MNVLHLITSLNRGGAENHLTCLIRGQLEKKINVFVVYLKGDGYWVNYLKSIGVKVLKLKEYNFFSQISVIKKIIKINNINIVHAHLPHMEILGFASLFGNKNLKFIITKHVDNDYFGGSQIKKNSIISSIISLGIYSRVNKIIAISNSVKKFLIKNSFINIKNKIKVIYYGLDKFYIDKCLSNNRTKFKPKSKLTFCFIGRLVKQKQVDQLILSFNNFYKKIEDHENKYGLLIVGSGPEKKMLINYSNELGINDKITWKNFTDDVGSIFQEIDVFCINSSFEGLGLVMLEAMAYSKPIIGPDISAIPEVIKNNINGLTVKAGDTNEYTDAMIKLTNDQKRDLLSRNSYKILKENFNFDVMISKVSAIYNEKNL